MVAEGIQGGCGCGFQGFRILRVCVWDVCGMCAFMWMEVGGMEAALCWYVNVRARLHVWKEGRALEHCSAPYVHAAAAMALEPGQAQAHIVELWSPFGWGSCLRVDGREIGEEETGREAIGKRGKGALSRYDSRSLRIDDLTDGAIFV